MNVVRPAVKQDHRFAVFRPDIDIANIQIARVNLADLVKSGGIIRARRFGLTGGNGREREGQRQG
ncbi:hypothetical protein D3C76_1394910 [compost metagenome]